MKGLVALLDPTATQRVISLWDELERHFNLHGVLGFPFPHISFNILDTYNTEQVEPELRSIAGRIKSFTIQTAGLGMFLFPEPVLYIPVVRSPQLNLVHQRLWRAFPQKMGSMSLYSPEHWVPHITLAVDDLVREQLPEVVDLMKQTNFHWTIRLDGLTFAVKTDTGYEFPCGCKFGG